MRKFDGTTFGAGVKIADAADDAQAHLTQDAAGRLHAVFAHGTAAGLELDYATSDNGASWQSGPLLTQTDAAQGIGALRAATAPDHIGVAAWETSSGADVRGPRPGHRPDGRRVAAGARQVGGRRRWSPGKVFFTSPAGKRTRLTGAAQHPRRQPDRHPQGPRAADLGGDRHRRARRRRPTSTRAPSRSGRALPEGNRAGRADHRHHAQPPRRRGRSARRRGAPSAAAVSKKKKGPHAVLGKLWGNGKGKFRTNGKYSSATVRGTIWLTEDRCDGTLTTVKRGTVSVRDLRRNKTVTVKAGHSYLARAR